MLTTHQTAAADLCQSATDCYWEGVFAFKRGETVNPYMPRTDFASAWETGWDSAKCRADEAAAKLAVA